MRDTSEVRLPLTPRWSTLMSSSMACLVAPIQHSSISQPRRTQKKFVFTLSYITNDRLSLTQPIISPICSLCTSPDSIEHALVSCISTSGVRSRLFPELMNTVSKVQPTSGILAYNVTPHLLTQFILDCTSPNLPDAIRVPMHNPDLPEIYRISRDWCFAIHSERLRLLRLSHK